MRVREVLKTLGKALLGAIPFLLGLAAAIVLRRSPADPAKQPVPKAPDMQKADENVEQLEEAQKELDQQHQQIEDVLAPKPQAKPSKDLQDAVDKWNNG